MKSGKRDTGTRHFSDRLWVDFARNVGSEEIRAELQAHLDAGCERCRGTASRFLAVSGLALTERTLAIPQELIDGAQKIAKSATSSAWIEKLTVVVGHLIEFSYLEWQPAGVRSRPGNAGPSGGRLLFRADDYAVYLKLEPAMSGGEAEIIGEIADEGERRVSMEGIPVQTASGGRIFRESVTNRFGEFLIGCPIRKNVTLRLALRDPGLRIDLHLESLVDMGTFGDPR